MRWTSVTRAHPGRSTPVLAISPSVLRIANRLSTSRNAWLEPNDAHTPRLGLGLTGRYGHLLKLGGAPGSPERPAGSAPWRAPLARPCTGTLIPAQAAV